MCDMQILLAIEVSVLCLATNGTLGDFAYHLFCVIFVILNMTKITQNRIIFQYVLW